MRRWETCRGQGRWSSSEAALRMEAEEKRSSLPITTRSFRSHGASGRETRAGNTATAYSLRIAVLWCRLVPAGQGSCLRQLF
jgi:hypothetical protein